MSKLYTMIFAVFAAFVAMAHGALNYKDANTLNRFSTWMNRFNIESKDETHLAHIFDNWISNDKYIEEVNGKNLTYTLGHNAYSGYSIEEFGQFMGFANNQEVSFKGLRGAVPSIDMNQIYDLSAIPSSVDWRAKGAVTPVKNQGSCGSCWSFSTTGALEGAYEIKYGKLVSFSEQQLVDCDYGLRLNHGCNGGLMDSAFSWISSNGGLCTESDYPYVSGTTKTNGDCKKTCSLVSGSKIVSYTDVTPNSDSAMMTALAQQPVSVAIEADQRAFQLYSGGVFSESCGTNLDHGVLLVGYGTDSSSGLDYYILKNSWDVSWGSSGFMYLGRNVDASGKAYNGGKGQCGVLMEGSYPNL
jgi:hypothetical protein